MIDDLPQNLSTEICDLVQSIRDIESHVKALKNKVEHSHQRDQKKMPEYIQTVIEYMGTRGCFRSRLFLRSLILLDNMLALEADLLSSAQFSKELVENVSMFFTHHQRNEEETEESINYAILYLVLLMISKASHCMMFRKILVSHMFKPKFLKKLFSLDVRRTSQTAKILPIIISFILRTKKAFTKDMNLK